MAKARLRANYFVDRSGIIIEKAPVLKFREKKSIYLRDGKTCQICRVEVRLGGVSSSPFEKICSGQIDHIFPRSKGGQNNQRNLQLLCLTCNSQKGVK